MRSYFGNLDNENPKNEQKIAEKTGSKNVYQKDSACLIENNFLKKVIRKN